MLKRLLAALLPLVFLSVAAHAQAPSAQPIYPVGKTVVFTETALGSGTKNEADMFNPGWQNIYCQVVQTAHTGTNGYTVAIQNKDVSSGNYTTLLTSATYTTDAEQNDLTVSPFFAASANRIAQAVLSGTQRVVIVVGATSSFTGKVTCTYR